MQLLKEEHSFALDAKDFFTSLHKIQWSIQQEQGITGHSKTQETLEGLKWSTEFAKNKSDTLHVSIFSISKVVTSKSPAVLTGATYYTSLIQKCMTGC